MSIHVTRAPMVPLTSYDTKRSSHLKLNVYKNILVAFFCKTVIFTVVYFIIFSQKQRKSELYIPVA